MSSDTSGGALYSVYRKRIGDPTTDDEVRGYWVFLVGLILGTLGIVLFLPSESAVGTSGFTLREASIVLSAIGLAMLVAGFVIRLPLQSWANYAAYVGQLLCFAAVVWFISVFPADWSVQTGNEPVLMLYAAGLALIAVGGVIGPLLVGVTREDLEASEGRAAELESELAAVRSERDTLQAELAETREDLEETREELDATSGELESAQEGSAAAAEVAATGETERAELASENEELRAELQSLRTSQAQFELYEDKGGKYRWRLRHRNGNVIADSAQGYTRKHNAQKGLASVKRNALGGAVIHILPEPDEEPEAALEAAPLIPEAVQESKAEFETYVDNAGEHRWRLVHRNGNIIADGGEGYSSKRSLQNGIDSVKNNVGQADYLRLDPTSFEVYRDRGGQWRWRLVHKNGNVLAAASEGYTRRRDAKRSVDAIRDTVADTTGFEIYEDNAGEYRWRLRAGNDEIIATSGEGYASNAGAKRSVERIREYGPEADALDVGFAAFEVYRDESEQWRWRLRHRNGNIIADCGGDYASRSGTHDAIESVKKNAPGAAVTAADAEGDADAGTDADTDPETDTDTDADGED